jgi:endo-1,4-beta-mannosidase
MNERIKKLAEQAGIHPANFESDADIKEPLEKFAELLIREYSYDVMNLHGAKPERVQYAAKRWGVEV